MNPNHKKSSVLKRLAAPCAAALLVLALPTTALAGPVRLMVDPGHGGKDPGAVSGAVQEKRTNLAISRMVVESAKRQGWKVDMTRGNDRFVPLNARPAKAKAFKATATVSIHSNSMGSRKTGNMTIYRDAKSKRLGRNIMDKMAPLTDYKDLGNRADSRGLAVLRGAKNPTVIVEVLSVSNPEENKALRDPKKQREAAEAIVAGVAGFHGVTYKPLTEPKSAPQSKAQPAAETTAPVKAEPTAEAPATAEKPAETVHADSQDAAGAPTREAGERTSAARSETAAAPLGERADWIGAFISLLTR